MTSVIMAVVEAVHGRVGEVTGLVQPTQSQDLKLVNEDATALLGLEGLALVRVELEEDGARVVHVATADESAAACPSCGVISTARKGATTTRPRDVGYGPDPIRLVWHKSRWRCRESLCARGSFAESLPQVPARCRLTTRLYEQVGAALADGYSCVQAAARAHGVSWPIAHAAYVDHVDPALAEPLPPVRVLGIDETRRGKPKWTRDQDSGKWVKVADVWHTSFVDAAGAGGLLGHVDSRGSAAVAAWIAAQPQAWRAGITHVAIDLSAAYAKAVREALPHAQLVADKFHVVQAANDALTQVRQRVTRVERGRRGRKRDPEWAARRRLLIAHEKLSQERFATLWNDLLDAGEPGIEILSAYTVKENLRQLLALPAGSDREVISHRLWRFYDQAAASSSPEIHRLAATVETWWPAIEAAITTGHSNAPSRGYLPLAGAGYNRLAKHQGRNAFGFRNPDNHRRRIRWACTRQHRRASAIFHDLPG